MEESRASRAQLQTGQVRLPDVTANIPAPTAVNNNCATLAYVWADVMGGQGSLPSSKQAMATTTGNFAYEGEYRSRACRTGCCGQNAAAASYRRHTEQRIYGAGTPVLLAFEIIQLGMAVEAGAGRD